ncbi:MAG: hypothetical protein LAP39_07665 [Acidobacteriia bacterium]|nr:hypothetical protein [Terriglobia bacterium]
MSTATLVERPQPLYQALLQQQGRAAGRAIPTPIPIPIPHPLPVVGSRFLIWKQDPSVDPPGLRLSYVPSLVLDGPRDSRIATELPNVTPVHANTNRDFIFAPGTPEADCAHTFAVVRETLAMYQRIRGGAAIPWAWNIGGNADPITAFPRAGVTANAFYSRGLKALKFFYFTPANATQPVYTCHSLDIVSHECGHAVLDGLKPGWLGATNPPQTGGLHESFGDLTAIFLACSQLDQVDAAVAMTKANLHDRNFLAALAEQFGAALGSPQGLRNADNDLKLSQVGNEVHAISQVFTGAMYHVLADIFAFEKNRQAAVKDPTRVLLEVASCLCKLLVEAIVKAPPVGATYADVVNQMLAISKAQGDPAIYRTFLRNRFTEREVVVSPVPLTAMAEGRMNLADPNYTEGQDLVKMEARKHAADQAPQDRSACCGTMQLPEYMLGDQKKLEKGVVIVEEDMIAAEVAELKKMFAR